MKDYTAPFRVEEETAYHRIVDSDGELLTLIPKGAGQKTRAEFICNALNQVHGGAVEKAISAIWKILDKIRENAVKNEGYYDGSDFEYQQLATEALTLLKSGGGK